MGDRSIEWLNQKIEDFINAWRGTPAGIMVSRMYFGGADYEDICPLIGVDYEEAIAWD